MDFRGMLEEQLQAVVRFNNVSCADELVEERDGVVFHGVWLNGCLGSDGGTVQAGLLLRNGCVGGFFYRVCQEEVVRVLARDALSGEVEGVLRELVQEMAKDSRIGSQDWQDAKRLGEVQLPVITDEKCLVNEKTGGKRWFLNVVLVDFGFSKQFSSLVLGWRDGVYAIAIADSVRYWEDGEKKEKLDLVYEADFLNAAEGNAVWKRVVQSRFISQKGNTVYCLSKDDLYKYFHRVKGVVLTLD